MSPRNVREPIPTNPHDWRPQVVKSGRYVPEVIDPILEPLWEGTRVIAHYRDSDREDEWGHVDIFDEDGEDASPDAPQAVEQLSRAIQASEAVIDGIITEEATAGGENTAVALFPTVNPIRKFFLGGSSQVDVKYEPRGPRRKGAPAFIALDLLSVDGQTLFDVPLLERKRLLDGLVTQSELVRLSPWVRSPIRSWFNTWRSAGFRGVIMKGANSRYRPGEETSEWALVERMPRR
jgi:bifunctional non-homologous end joining protein LigD